MAGLFKEMAHGIETGSMRFEGSGTGRRVRGPTTLESACQARLTERRNDKRS